MSTVIKNFISALSPGKRIRVLAFGSSNTERYLPDSHWFDCFELAIKQKYGRVHTCINTGISGHTTCDLLKRFEDDAEFFKPQLAFVTIGGNDCNPDKDISIGQFRNNLKELYERFSAIDCGIVFQTYYSPNPDDVEKARLNNFYKYMDVVREVAIETQSALIDHLARWERLRLKHPDIYIKLMLNGFHTNPAGNKVMGVDIARHFGIIPNKDQFPFWAEAIDIQHLMDQLEKEA